MKKKILVVLLSAGCLVVPACLSKGIDINDVRLGVCFPGNSLLSVCVPITD